MPTIQSRSFRVLMALFSTVVNLSKDGRFLSFPVPLFPCLTIFMVKKFLCLIGIFCVKASQLPLVLNLNLQVLISTFFAVVDGC